MKEHQARCRGIGGRIDIPFVALARAIGNVEMLRVFGAKFGGGGQARGDALLAVGNGRAVVIGGVALGIRHTAPIRRRDHAKDLFMVGMR
jgi:hypothetical protein